MRIINARTGATVTVGGRYLGGDGRWYILDSVEDHGYYAVFHTHPVGSPATWRSAFNGPVRRRLWWRWAIIPT